MNKLLAVFKREYLQAVRKKMFIIMTILLPFLMAALMILPGLMVAKGLGEKRIAVLDGTGRLRQAFVQPAAESKPKKDAREEARDAFASRRGPELPEDLRVEYVDASEAKDLDAAVKPYLDRMSRGEKSQHLHGAFVIPHGALEDEKAKMKYYSQAAADFVTQERLSRLANHSLQQMRLEANGFDSKAVEKLMRELPIEPVQLSRSGEQKKGGELNFLFAFVFGALLIIPSINSGNEIMRGIVQEKHDRVIEILVSSMSPAQLLTGKILGVAAVGLTQITVWMLMILAIGTFGATAALMAGVNVMQFLRPQLFIYFFIFFVLAYLTYVCAYAIAGAVCNSDKEAQQLVAPVVMLMMVPWFLMFPIITNPDSKLAVGFSMSPVFGPITMFVRTLVSDPPPSQIAMCLAVAVATISLALWATAKIFRIGILSYGKRPTLPELWRWLKVA